MTLELPVNLTNTLRAAEAGAPIDIPFDKVDLEWLFFGALFHQFAIFGGRAPVLDLSDESLENFEDSGEFDATDIEEISWPPLPALKLDEMDSLIQIFSDYAASPRLWSAGMLHEEGEYLSLDVESLVAIPELQLGHVRQALIGQIESKDWGHLSLIAAETARMLGDQPVFRFPGDPD